MKTSGISAAVAAAVVALFSTHLCWSQPYPVKPVRLVLQGPGGSGPDLLMRPIARKLSDSMGQQVLIDNRPGAAGLIAAQNVAGSPADGYTLLLGSSGSHSIVPFLHKKRPYDPVEDFTPITLLVIAPLAVLAHPSLPVKSVRDLISLAKAKPKQLLYASQGAGTVQHLTMEMFSRATAITMIHIPYKGGGLPVADTVSGQVHLVIATIQPVLPHVAASRLRALAVTSSERVSALPEVATIAESGVRGFDSVQWWGMFAPKGTAALIVERLFNELRKATVNAEAKTAYARDGLELNVSGPRVLAEFHRSDMLKWQKVIRENDLRLE